MRRPHRWLVLALGAAPLVLGSACGSFDTQEAEKEPSGTEGGADTSTVDVAAESQATDAPFDGNVDAAVEDGAIFVHGFETGATCDGWEPINNAMAEPASPGRTGTRGCLICASAPSQGMFKKNFALDAGSYAFTTWARTLDAGVDSGSKVILTITVTADGGTVGYTTNGRDLSTKWQQAQAVLNTGRGVAFFYIQPEKAECIMVDDVVLTR